MTRGEAGGGADLEECEVGPPPGDDNVGQAMPHRGSRDLDAILLPRWSPFLPGARGRVEALLVRNCSSCRVPRVLHCSGHCVYSHCLRHQPRLGA